MKKINKFIKNKVSKEIIALTSVLIIGLSFVIAGFSIIAKHNKFDSSSNVNVNDLGDDNGWGRSSTYDMQHYEVKNSNNNSYSLDPNFNFQNGANVLIVFQSTQNFKASEHANNISNTNPSKTNPEYTSSSKMANSCDVFISNLNDNTIYFSAHANGGASHWQNFTITPNKKGNTITVLKLSGSVDHFDTTFDYPVAKQSNGSPYPIDKQSSTEWQRYVNACGNKLSNDPGNQSDEVTFFHNLAQNMWNYDHPDSPMNGSDNIAAPHHVYVHIFV